MGSWSQAVLANTMETGDKNRDMTAYIVRVQCMFCEESLEKINEKDVKLFQNRSVNELYRLKAALNYFGTSEILQWLKKEESL